VSSAAWHGTVPVWHITYSGGMEHWHRGAPEVQLKRSILDCAAHLAGEAAMTGQLSMFAGPRAVLDGAAAIHAEAAALLGASVALHGRAAMAAAPALVVSPEVYLAGDAEVNADPGMVAACHAVLSGEAVLDARARLAIKPRDLKFVVRARKARAFRAVRS
jgi:hypothetical protein